MMRATESCTEWLERLIWECRSSGSLLPDDGQVAEVELLLLAAEIAALESAARYHGQTVGQMIRQIVRGFLNQSMDHLS
jgi:hypothetical protein